MKRLFLLGSLMMAVGCGATQQNPLAIDEAADAETSGKADSAGDHWFKQLSCDDGLSAAEGLVIDIQLPASGTIPDGVYRKQAVIKSEAAISYLESKGVVKRNDPYNHQEAILTGETWYGWPFFGYGNFAVTALGGKQGFVDGEGNTTKVSFTNTTFCPDFCSPSSSEYDPGNETCLTCQNATFDVANWVFRNCH